MSPPLRAAQTETESWVLCIFHLLIVYSGSLSLSPASSWSKVLCFLVVSISLNQDSTLSVAKGYSGSNDRKSRFCSTVWQGQNLDQQLQYTWFGWMVS